MVGVLKANVDTPKQRAALLLRLIHETGHTIGLDERCVGIISEAPGLKYDAMNGDNADPTRVLDPTHVTEYLTFATELMTRASPGATVSHEFLLSTFIDNTRGGFLFSGEADYPAAQTAARATAVDETLRGTVQWLRSQIANGVAVSDLIPHVPKPFIAAKPQIQPQGVGDGLIPR